MRAATRHHDAYALEIVAFANQRNASLDNFHRVDQSSRSDGLTRETSGIRPDEIHATPAQCLHVLLRGGVLVHVGVHCGRNENRRARRKQRSRQPIIGDAVCGSCDEIRGGRRDEVEVCALRYGDVLHVRVLQRREHMRNRCASADRLEGRGADEFARRFREYRRHVCPVLRQTRRDLAGLVCRDRSRHAKDDFPIRENPLHRLRQYAV